MNISEPLELKLQRRIARWPAVTLIMYSGYHVSAFFYGDLPTVVLSILFYAGVLTALVTVSSPAWLIHGGGRIGRPLWTLVLVLITFWVTTLLHQAILTDVMDRDGRSALAFASGIVTIAIVWSVWGGAIQFWKAPRSILVSAMILVLVAVPIAFNIDDNLLVSYMRLSDMRGGDIELTHLYLGDNSVILLLLAYSVAPKPYRFAIAVISVILLFSLGGRSALYIFAIVIAVYEFRAASVFKVAAVFGAIAIAAALIFNMVDLTNPAVERMLVSQGIAEDLSVQGREEYFLIGLAALAEQIWLGDPTFPARTFGTVGAFIHNGLSGWQLFGFLPFAFLLLSTINIGRYIHRNFGRLTQPTDEFGMLLFAYSCVSVLLVKSLSFSLFWLAIGFWLLRMNSTPQGALNYSVRRD